MQELSRFAAAKQLTYIGDNFRAAQVIGNLMETVAEQPVFEEGRLTSIETDLGVFVGSAQRRVTPDGHRLEMFRGVQRHTSISFIKAAPGRSRSSWRRRVRFLVTGTK